ncbi:hypothetical protein COOONC_23317, partial [Cooperia oncophora]
LYFFLLYYVLQLLPSNTSRNDSLENTIQKDTYCRQDNVAGQPLMVWVMDTVDDPSRDEMRWLAWADVYLVVYDVTSMRRIFLERIATHEHLLCAREHKTLLLGNKNDLERYRQVSETEGEAMANKYKIHFAESSAAGDSPCADGSKKSIASPVLVRLRDCLAYRAGQVRSKVTKPVSLHKTPSLSKIKTGSKLLKLFHN